MPQHHQNHKKTAPWLNEILKLIRSRFPSLFDHNLPDVYANWRIGSHALNELGRSHSSDRCIQYFILSASTLWWIFTFLSSTPKAPSWEFSKFFSCASSSSLYFVLLPGLYSVKTYLFNACCNSSISFYTSYWISVLRSFLRNGYLQHSRTYIINEGLKVSRNILYRTTE